MESWAIDNAWSKDPDDAIGWDGRSAWVHVADPASAILPDSAADKEALGRGSTLYLPELTAPMLPEEALERFGLGLAEGPRRQASRRFPPPSPSASTWRRTAPSRLSRPWPRRSACAAAPMARRTLSWTRARRPILIALAELAAKAQGAARGQRRDRDRHTRGKDNGRGPRLSSRTIRIETDPEGPLRRHRAGAHAPRGRGRRALGIRAEARLSLLRPGSALGHGS
jgi:hypothetical protein